MANEIPGLSSDDETTLNSSAIKSSDSSTAAPDAKEGDVTDTDDGGAIVQVGKPAPPAADKTDFYDNLVNTKVIDPTLCQKLALELDERIREDKKSREDRDKQYAEGIQRTGLGKDAPGGATFAGASRAVHPVLSKACIDFEARAIAELMPPAGAVKEYIPEPNVTQADADKAKRVASHMNWQLIKQMPEFRPELEQCLSQVGLGGSQFMYMCWDEKRRRPSATYWPSDDVIIPYGASSARSAERLTQVERISQRVYTQRVKTGYYAEPIDPPSVVTPEQTPAEKAAEKVEGVKPDVFNKDGLRIIWRCYTELELPDDPETNGELAPYIIEQCEDRSGCKRVVRNWDKEDKLREPMQWLVEFPFLPWRGALSIGLGHVIGSLSGAATGALRSLLDCGLINNFPAVLKLKGANFSGQTKQLDACSVVEVEGGVAGIDNDIRKLISPIPYNPPNTVLFQLLGFLGEEAEAVVQTTMKNLSDAAANTLPVGTALAMIEQGMKVFAGVHQRLLHAMTQLLQVLYRINKQYLQDNELKNEAGTILASRQDYNGPMNVIPVADPNIFSDAQRFAQTQIIADRASQFPQLYDLRKVEMMILERTRIPDAKQLLQPDQQPEEMHAVNENMAMALGRPVMAYPEQDHLAHIQVLLDFMDSPVLGQSPIIAPKFLGQALDHLGQHICMWYINAMYKAGSEATGQPLEKLMGTKDPEANAEMDRLLAQISPATIAAAQQHFGNLPPIIQKAQQTLQQYTTPPPPDNSLGVAQITSASREKVAGMQIQAKQQDAQAKQQGDQQKLGAQQQGQAAQQAGQERIAQLRLVGERTIQQMKDDSANERTQLQEEVKQQVNQADNETAMTISAAEIAAGKKSNVSTGTGINPK